MAYKPTLVNLTPEQKSALRVKAGKMTAQTGETVSVNDLIRQAIEQMLAAANHSEPEPPPFLSRQSIQFVPIAAVEKAIRRAASDSGRPVGDVVNSLLAEAIQTQEV